MTGLDTSPTPQERLAASFARRIARWAAERTPGFAGLAVLEAAAQRVSLAVGEGHVCADLAALPAFMMPGGHDAVRKLLLDSGVVARPADPHPLPLVLDDDGRLYLYRYFDYECRLAAALRRLAGDPIAAGAAAAPESRERLRELFGAAADGEADWQKIAAALALLGRLTIISGGPGTGKTTTVVNILACLIAEQPGCRIALAAPTGKAAARVLMALRERAGHLAPELHDQMPQTAFTIHRLLGMLPQGGFRHHADNPLAIDVLVVDEASMLDLALATRLVEAIPPGARLILLGDKDQLAAVEAGAVFSEIAADPSLTPLMRTRLAELTDTPAERIVPPVGREPTPLNDSVVWFSRNYRFGTDSGIGLLAARVNAGDWDGARIWLEHGGDASVQWSDDGSMVPAKALVERLLDGYQDFLQTLRDHRAEPSAVLEAFNRFRVLCALRESARGVVALNRVLAAGFRRRLSHPLDTQARSDWFPGRPVLILRNDYALRLFNGDIGIALADAGGALRVYFPDADGSFRALPPVRLPEHETAFAMTVHKSQGSEFDAIALMLPAQLLPVVSRELIYTGVTRAKQRVELIGSAAVLGAGIAAPSRRHSGLIARLQDLAASCEAAQTASGSDCLPPT